MPETSDSSSISRWAILIGVDLDLNEDGTRSKQCLRGAVEDVSRLEKYLKDSPHEIDTTKLTATVSCDPLSNLPTEDPELWPTHQNVQNSLLRVFNMAAPGDLVYIHFSGHGTRRKRTNADLDSMDFVNEGGNMALVLFEYKNYFKSYFHGEQLADCLRLMASKDLKVTLVLDCCFSGSVLRAEAKPGSAVRTLEYNSIFDAASRRDVSRTFKIATDKWLVDPSSYVMFTACGLSQKAEELEIGVNQRRGALSFFLEDALKSLGKESVDITHESLYERLRVEFRAARPQQTPMQFGKAKASLFGTLQCSPNSLFPSIYKQEGKTYLDAGKAHGVTDNATYTAYPFGPQGDQPTAQGAEVVRVIAVEPLRSELEVRGSNSYIRTGWRARPTSSLPQRKVGVRITPEARQQLGEMDDELLDNNFIALCDDGELSLLTVEFDDSNAYKVPGLQPIPASIPGARDRLLNALHHMATFKYFESLKNENPERGFQKSFTVMGSTDDCVQSKSRRHFDVTHGKRWHFEVQNHDESPLYLAMFGFFPSWKIENSLKSAGDNGFKEVEASSNGKSGILKIRLIMDVPETLQKQGETSCEDIIKVFLTRKHTTFPQMIMCELSQDARHLRSSGPSRLSTLLQNLTSSSRGNHDSWATDKFHIRTSLKS